MYNSQFGLSCNAMCGWGGPILPVVPTQFESLETTGHIWRLSATQWVFTCAVVSENDGGEGIEMWGPNEFLVFGDVGVGAEHGTR